MSNCPLNVTVRLGLWLARVLPPPEDRALFALVKVSVVVEPLLAVKFILPTLYWLSVKSPAVARSKVPVLTTAEDPVRVAEEFSVLLPLTFNTGEIPSVIADTV